MADIFFCRLRESGLAVASNATDVTMNVGMQAYSAVQRLAAATNSTYSDSVFANGSIDGAGGSKSRGTMYVLGATAVLAIIFVSYLATGILALLSYFFTILLWWYIALVTARTANEVSVTLHEVEANVFALEITSKKRVTSSGSTSLLGQPLLPVYSPTLTSRRLLTMVESTLRGRIAFWLTSAFWCGIVNLTPSSISACCDIATPFILVASVLLGVQFGSLWTVVGRLLISPFCGHQQIPGSILPSSGASFKYFSGETQISVLDSSVTTFKLSGNDIATSDNAGHQSEDSCSAHLRKLVPCFAAAPFLSETKDLIAVE